ncbi:MAG TPA: Calx-beta domain-containing protein [Pirellulales bacterium]|nr:Calx-beta domain-containing protein [Pirellulales bacterium]
MSLNSILDRLAGQPAFPRRKKRLRPPRFFVEGLEQRRLLAVITVNSTGDSNQRDDNLTLREAILLANGDLSYSSLTDSEKTLVSDLPAANQLDSINFEIGSGLQTITVASALPDITDSVIIDGTTQPGYAGQPLIDIDGSQQSGNTAGLDFTVGGNTVKGLIISNFPNYGLRLDGTGDFTQGLGSGLNNIIQANFIGTDPSGKNAEPNKTGGIYIAASSDNLIGGVNQPGELVEGNLISGNGETGILVATGTDSNNYIEGNYLGTDVTGLQAIANAPTDIDGVAMVPPLDEPDNGYASNNVIGNFDPRTNEYEPLGGNVIAGNTEDGVLIVGGSGNQVVGNDIGVGVDGTTPVPNAEDGVRLVDASSNTIGNTQDDSRNVISGNTRNGVEIDAAAATEYGLPVPLANQGASNNKIQGNYIGTDVSGTTFVPNGNPADTGKSQDGEGIVLRNLATDPRVFVGGLLSSEGNLIGGAGAARNLISGNWDDGILMAGANVLNNTVEGNYIGTDKTGTNPLPNSNFGVELTSIAGQNGAPSDNVIGTTDGNGGNLISGNGTSAQGTTPAIGGGVALMNGASANILQNNLIGTDYSGLKFLPNSGNGVFISAADGNTIGGDSDDDANIISGNDGNGVTIVDTTGNKVEKNEIGVGFDDATRLPNLEGIALIGATGNFIGGVQTVGGEETSLGNVISANSTTGISFAAQANSNYVLCNKIGTDNTGQFNLGNADAGILIDDSSANQIGGTTTAARNLIVFNNGDGIDIKNVANNGTLPPNVIEGDYIGVGPDGTQPEGNAFNGILIINSSLNTIGGTLVNVISDNGQDGVQVAGHQSQSNTIAGNYIGTTADGNSPLPNTNGIDITAGASSTTIGGGAAGSNVVSGNQQDGIYIGGAGEKNTITNSYIGLNASGTGPLTGTSPQHNGIVVDATPSTVIGADSFPDGGNVISGNQFDGIFVGGPSNGTQITGNYIGTDKKAAGQVANGRLGIDLAAQSSFNSNTPSSQTTVAGNVISGNLQGGVALSSGTNGNHLENNFIGTNSQFVSTIPNYGYGVYIANSPGNFIGAADAGNKIYFTAVTNNIPAVNGVGIFITGLASTGNDVADNDVFHNVTAGIEIAGGASGSKIGNTQGNDVDANFNGIVITDSGTQKNTVESNYVGIDEDNTPNIGNTHDGILVTAGASGNIIGEIGAGNVISENTFNGIEISGDGTSDNSVFNNNIGTDVEGNFKDQSFGNGYGIKSGGIGIDISAPNNHIGGSADHAGNLIVQSFRGIGLEGANATGNTIEGNKINNNGDSGILVTNGASGNTIGGPNDADGNSIHDNLGNGVSIFSGTDDSIRHNTIYANGKLGIALGTDAKANNLQPAALLSVTATRTRLTGWLEAAPDTTYYIDFYKGQQLAQADGTSEADDARNIIVPFLPSSDPDEAPQPFEKVTTNDAGLGLFDLAFGASPDVGTIIRATVTDPDGDTSQFSNPAVVEEDTTGVGVPDDDQNGNSPSASNVSFRDALDSSLFINMQTSAGAFENVWSIPNPSATDAPVHTEFSLGFADFTIAGLTPGQHVTVTMTLPVEISGPVDYWRYNLTTKQWYKWDYDPTSDTGAQIDGNIITLHFVDGGRGDDDGAANGVIVDPGSPGFPDLYTVTTRADSGPGSLRQAILNADANPGSEITFDIPGSGPQTIQLLSPLPQITADVMIDGSTQPGFAGTPLVELDGRLAGGGADGLNIAGGVATIKGLAIDRFVGDGIYVLSAGSATIVGNYLGVDTSGRVVAPNGLYGIEIENNTDSSDDDEEDSGSPSTVDKGNIVSGNLAGGIFIHGVGASGNFVAGNFIGTQSDGVSPLGNGGPGVLIGDGASGNDIGFRSADEGNTIAFNAGPGVDVLQGSGNLIEANSIFANQDLGIDLGGDGVTPNDPGDTDGLQNYPVLMSAASYGGRTFISGALTSAPDSFYTVDFYASNAADPSGFGQGQFFLGSISVDTDDSGQASFDANVAAPVAVGSFITATASLGGNTSEFSAALKLTPTNSLVLIVNTTDDLNDAAPDPTDFSLREAIEAANAHQGQDIIDFDLPNLDRVILPQSALPDISDPVIIDGTSQPGYQGLPLVEIDGSQAVSGADGLRITGGGSIVRGLAIHSFQSATDNLGVLVGGNAIELTGLGGNLIEGNLLGTDVTGTRALPDQRADLYIFGSPDNVVGGMTAAARNVIVSVVINDFDSDTDQVIDNAGGNRLEGDYIGVDLTGTATLAGGGVNIENSAANTIGGTAPGAGNVIAGGLAIDDGSSNIVQGNLIGTDFTGTVPLGGGSVAISGQGRPAEFNQIGGSTPVARNVIAGNVIIEGADGSENVVQGNYIGTDITGSVALHAQASSISGVYAGVDINGAFNQVGGSAPGEGNLISGFVGEGEGDGVLLEASARNNQIQGNLIGTDAMGTKPLGNVIGIEDRGSGNLIGGPDPGEGNLISANQTYGLELVGSGGDTVQGNLIGTDRSGKLSLGNGAFTSENDGIYVTGPNNVIGGSLPGEGNVISANGGNGISVHLAINTLTDASGITVQGNYIGTDVTGTLPLANGGDGIYVNATPNMVIGGTLPGEGNLISGNGGDGVEIVDAITDLDGGNQSSGAVIQGNKIGTDVTGTARLGNAADGVSIVTSYAIASNETVGGPDPGDGNTIAFNGGRGVHVPFGMGNTVRGNDIFANRGPGLVTDINDALSTYAEERAVTPSQPVPLLTSATFDPQGTVVTGSLTGIPFTRYEIDFFANDTVNLTGFGDGQMFLQSMSVLSDDTGSVQFQIPLDDPVPIGQWITATATPDTADGNTSMFSQPAPVVAAAEDSIQFSSPSYLVTETGGEAVIVVTRSGSTIGTVTVHYATSDGAAVAGTNYTASSGTLTFGDGQTSQTITIPVQHDGLADGDKDLHVLLSNPNGAALGAVSEADVTIADSDSAGQIEFSSAAYPVVDKALGNAVLTVTRTEGSQGAVSVDYRVTGGTGVGVSVFQLGESVDADYLDSFGTVTFAPGQTAAQITILQILDLIDDNLLTPAYRGPRTIELALGNPTGGAVLGATITSTVTIDDEEDQHGAFDVPSQLQVSESDGQAVVEIIRTGQLSTTEEVSYTTADGTAKAGTNYVATSGTVVFQPGQTQAFIDVPIIDDHVVDTPGDFRFVLSNPTGGAFVYDGLGTSDVTIADSDTPPQLPRFEVETNQSFNGDSGTAPVTVERLGNTSGFAQVDYTTSDGTAKAGTDYQMVSGTLLFGPGEASATFTVPLLANSLTTGDLTFNVTLSNPSTGATIDPNNPMPVTLVYQAAGQVQFASPTYPVAENSAELTVTVKGPRSGTVDYATHGGTATAGADYTAVSGTLSFGQTGLATISIPILNDLLVESNETFSLSLSNPKGGVSLGNPATTTITILDEDSPQIVQSTTTLKSNLSGGSTYGQGVTFTASVSAGSGTPTGSVDFVDSTTGEDLGSSQLAVVNGVDEASVTASTLNVGSHAIIATYTSDNSNLVGSHDLLTQTVFPATLTVTADSKEMVLGTTVPALTDTITGFVNDDASTVVSGTPTLSTTATSTSPVGSYPIVVGPGTLSATNYTFVLVNGTLTVTPGGSTPVLTLVHDVPVSTTEGSSATLTGALLGTTDSDTSVAASAIVYTMTAPPTLGTLTDKGKPVAGGDSFSQQDIDDGSVTYESTEEGADSFAFSVASGAAAAITGTLTITASDPAVVATGGFTYSATEGTLGAAETVAAFTDPGGAEALADYTITIDWGDGTSAAAGTLSINPNTHVLTATGQHDYAANGTFPITVTLTHESAPTVTVSNTAEITSAAGTGEGGIAASGLAVSGYEFGPQRAVTVATFSEGDGSLPTSDFSATINWGDGATSAGSITLVSGTYAVSGSHEYLDEGHYRLKVGIEQTAGPGAGGTSATVTAAATIHEQLLENGTVGTVDENWVQEAYRDLFDRQAERQGLGYWVGLLNEGETRQQVAYQIVKIASFEEFQHDTVTALYEQYLGRAPDAGGLAYWSAYLYDGGTIEGMSQALLSSPEYWQSRGGGTVEGFLSVLFQNALGRQIEPAAVTYFEGLMSNGASAADVAAAVLNSDEYHRLRVDLFFEQFLNRPADPNALAYFADELDSGGTDELVISQMLASDEYFAIPQV